MNYYKLKFILDILMISLGIVELVLFPLDHSRRLLGIFMAIMLILVGVGDLLAVIIKRRKLLFDQS